MTDSVEIKKAGNLLSKSRLLSGIQCPKRLFLEVHSPELAEQSDEADSRIKTGYQAAEVARRLYPDGIMVAHQDDLSLAVEKTYPFTTEVGHRPGINNKLRPYG